MMKAIELNKDSWHYKLASRANPYFYSRGEEDICSYTKYVFLGFLEIILISFVVLLLGGFTVNFFYSCYTWLFLNQPFNEFAVVFGCVVGGLLNACAIAYFCNNAKEKMSHTEPGFVRLAYRSWKDKFCVKITFVDKNANQRSHSEA